MKPIKFTDFLKHDGDHVDNEKILLLILTVVCLSEPNLPIVTYLKFLNSFSYIDTIGIGANILKKL